MGATVLKYRWLLLCLGFFLVSCCMSLASSQSTTEANGGFVEEKKEDSDEATRKALLDNLESLSVEELEAICIERGLEVVRDNTLTHADFVEAARQCLAFEEQLLEVLDQYPDLEEEVTADLERLQKEKKDLERERDEKLAEKERLQKKLQEMEEQRQDSSASDSSRAAFGIPKSSQQGTPPPTLEKADEETTDSADTLPVNIPSVPNNFQDGMDENNESYDSTNSLSKSEQIDDYETDFQDLDDSSSPDSNLETIDPDNLLTIRGVAEETFKQIQSDLRKLKAILARVAEKLSGAKEFALKYFRVLFMAFQPQEQQQQQQ